MPNSSTRANCPCSRDSRSFFSVGASVLLSLAMGDLIHRGWNACEFVRDVGVTKV